MTTYGPWLTQSNVTDHHDFDNTGTFLAPPSTFWTSTGTSEDEAARGVSNTPTFSEHIQVGHVIDMSGVTPSSYRWGRFVLSWTPPYHSYPPPPPPRASWDFAEDGAVLDATLTLTAHTATVGTAGAIYYGAGDWRSTTPPLILGSVAFGASPTLTVSASPMVAGSGVLGGATFGVGVGVLFDVWDSLMTDGVPGGVSTDTAFVEFFATITATIRPSRYRAAYDVLPPLRQYPRDDSLGGAPRQGKANGSTSLQSSARQGWKNVYR